jgi:hypothetical protein
MCIYTMFILSVYLVSDLEGSDNGDPTNGIIYCLSAVNHMITVVSVLETLNLF